MRSFPLRGPPALRASILITGIRILTDKWEYHGGYDKPKVVVARNKSFHIRNEDEASGYAGSEDELGTNERVYFSDKLPSHGIIGQADAGI